MIQAEKFPVCDMDKHGAPSIYFSVFYSDRMSEFSVVNTSRRAAAAALIVLQASL